MFFSILAVGAAALLTYDAKDLLLSDDSKSRYNQSPGRFLARGVGLVSLAVLTAMANVAGLVAMVAGCIYLGYSVKRRLAIAENRVSYLR